MERLIDTQTLAAVIAATPVLPTERDRAREVIIALKVLTCPDSSRDYFKATLGDIALETATIDSEEITAKEIGSIIRRLGLSSHRTRGGYVCVWSREQLDILSNALLSEDPSAATEGPSGETNSPSIIDQVVV